MPNIIYRFLKPGVFRVILAILVVLFHASRYFPFGAFAVHTFFILSGYWVYRMYEIFYCKQKSPYKFFILSRVLRIYPLYFICTVFALVLVISNRYLLCHQISDFLNFSQIISLTTLIPYNYLDAKLLPPAWSLGIELQFYILLPIFIYLFNNFNKLLVFAIIVALSIFASFSSLKVLNLSILPYLLYFIIGMLIWSVKPVLSKKTVSIFLFIIGIILLLHYSIPFLQRAVFTRDVFIYGINYFAILSAILPLLCIPLIIFSLNLPSDKKDKDLGNLSYTIYLFHWIPFSIYNYFFAKSETLVRAPMFLCYLLVLGFTSWLLYTKVEWRIEQKRSKFLLRINTKN